MELGGEEAVRNMAKTYLKVDTAKARAMFTDRAGLITKSQEALAEIFINAILSFKRILIPIMSTSLCYAHFDF